MARLILFLGILVLTGSVSDAAAQSAAQLWTSNGANKLQLLSDGTTTDLAADNAFTPWGVTVDPVAGFVYWGNVTEGTIKRANLDGSDVQTLFTDLDLPRGIALDTSTNTLFWAEAGINSPGIKRSDLDELPLNVTEVATSIVVSPYHLALDTDRQFIYWADNASTVKEINRIRFDGSGAETIISSANVKQVAGLALDAPANTLYWSDFSDDAIYSADADAKDQNIQIILEFAEEATPWAMDVDTASGILYWTDYLNSSIHQIDLPTSTQTVIASGVSVPSGIAVFTEETITPGDPGNFVTTWKSDNDGVSDVDQLTIPTAGSGYNYDLYWEEVDNDTNNGMELNNRGDLTLTFPSAGVYRVEIAGAFPRIFFNGGGDAGKLLSIVQWGDIEWSSMEGAFYGAENFVHQALDKPDLSSVTSLASMFRNAAMIDYDLGEWDITTVTTMENMLSNTGLSTENYDKTLIGWSVQTVQSNVQLGADGLQYCQGGGAEARQKLIDDYNWVITDAGPASDCIPTHLDNDGSLPVDFSLHQNYPNPFNPTTQISFDLTAAGEVQLTIYDLTGRTVQTLVKRVMAAGSHEVTFDASQLSSGVYLYRLETPGFTSTRKMMLVK